MTQPRTTSLIESCLNVSSGFVISYVLMVFIINPVYQTGLTSAQNFEITMIFTVISVARVYVWRRIFNSKGNT